MAGNAITGAWVILCAFEMESLTGLVISCCMGACEHTSVASKTKFGGKHSFQHAVFGQVLRTQVGQVGIVVKTLGEKNGLSVGRAFCPPIM